ncbi:MAG: hypothetical protein KAU29_00790 [Gammaproteobacteria bacterium]|nr:hypothetical protein [Gammaproteobacteria bacterium]
MADDSIEIHQRWAPGFGVKVTLLNGRELHVEKKAKPHRTKYIIDLLALEDASQQKTILGWKWIVAGLVAILSMVLCLTFLPMPDESMLYTASVYIVGLAVGGGCFYMAWKGTSRKQVFHSRSANVPLIELAVNNPSKKAFDDFVGKVEELIQSSREGLVISANNQLAGEMKMLRRLSEEGVLGASVYKKAKDGLLKQH